MNFKYSFLITQNLVCLQSLITFVNKHLNKINLEVSELETQFHDGVYLTLLMGLLEGFFVPLYDFYLTPQDFDQKVHNVSFAFELMQDTGLAKPKARPEGLYTGPRRPCPAPPLILSFIYAILSTLQGHDHVNNNVLILCSRHSEPGSEINPSRSLQSVYQV